MGTTLAQSFNNVSLDNLADGEYTTIDNYNFFVQNHLLHNPVGPAITDPNGNTQYRINGVLHRIDGPAYTFNTSQYWYNTGKAHRLYGPAVVVTNNGHLVEEWWVSGRKIANINKWISDNDLPEYSQWNDDQKALFAKTFNNGIM